MLSVGYLIGVCKVDQIDADEVCGQYSLNLSLIFSSVSLIIWSSISKRDLQGENVLLFYACLMLLIAEVVAILVLPSAIAIASFKLLRDKLCPSKVVVGEMIPSVDEDGQSLPHTEGEKVATEDMTFRVPDFPSGFATMVLLLQGYRP